MNYDYYTIIVIVHTTVKRIEEICTNYDVLCTSNITKNQKNRQIQYYLVINIIMGIRRNRNL